MMMVSTRCLCLLACAGLVSAARNCAVTRSCPSPHWEPSYAMQLSLAIQPCNATGYFTQGSEFGLVSFDWSNAKDVWSANPNTKTNCSEMLVEQARIVKSGSPSTKVFVYRNLELALEWIRGQRTIMQDPSKSGYFLQYQSGPSKGIVYDENQFNGLKQYFWDFRNTSAVDAFIADAIGPDAVGNEAVDGIFTDDVDGTFEEHNAAVKNMGYTPEEVSDIIAANQVAYDRIITALIAKKGYNWQAIAGGDGTSGDVLPKNQATCESAMRKLCPTSPLQGRPTLLPAGGKSDTHIADTTVAAFLIARGPFWWIGTGWQGCTTTPTTWQEDPLMQIDPGTPTSNCVESSKGVYSRAFTKGNATLDCNTWKATLDFHA